MATTTKQKKAKKGKSPTVVVTLASFDDKRDGSPVYRTVRGAVKLKNFKPITGKEYNPWGGTPLLDATVTFIREVSANPTDREVRIGILMDESGSMQPERIAVIESVNAFVNGLRDVDAIDPAVAGKGFLVIATDGEENASREFGYEDVTRAVKEREAEGWITVFLGAGIDGWGQGRKLGLSGTARGQTVSTVPGAKGRTASMGLMAGATMAYLSDSASYLRSTKGTYSIGEEGEVTDENIGQSTKKADLGSYDPSDALKKVRGKLR